MNPKTRKSISTLLIWVLMGGLILYMISGGFTTRTPDEITVQDFVKLVEEKKVLAVHETLGTGLYTGLYTNSTYAVKDLPNRSDFSFTCSEEEFAKNMSLLIARTEGKDADAVSSVDYPFTYTVSQPKGLVWGHYERSGLFPKPDSFCRFTPAYGLFAPCLSGRRLY